MKNNSNNYSKIHIGIDAGAVYIKSAVIINKDIDSNLTGNHKKYSVDNHDIYLCEPLKAGGSQFDSVLTTLNNLLNQLKKDNISFSLGVTGAGSHFLAKELGCLAINEFKAVAYGTHLLCPEIKTILEIGGDRSKFMIIDGKSSSNGNKLNDINVSILDYERNGECAAGTGSFIDQQAVRMNYEVEQLGELILDADKAANIAGRCSVFAKSDMIHAQQRGFSPESIMKGLCEAVVRNYKGTVLRGKKLNPQVAFIGGVAQNEGISLIMKEILDIDDEHFNVPDSGMHHGALGAAILTKDTDFSAVGVTTSKEEKAHEKDFHKHTNKLDSSKVRVAPLEQLTAKHTDYPIDCYLGIDIGSVSSNFVLIDTNGMVVDDIYTRTESRPVEVTIRSLGEWKEKWGDKVNIIGVGTTGSGRELVGELVGADAVFDEITAHKKGAGFVANKLYGSDVDTIFEIGGQDSKFISIEDGIVVDFTMNEACAAGTGSFLEEQAQKMDIQIKEEFAKLALSSEKPLRMGERCTVFMEKDVTSYMSSGENLSDICAGLSYAVVQNYLNRVVRERKIGDNIFFQGGTAFNGAVAAAFSTVLGKTITVPPYNGVMGAIGAAHLAKDSITKRPRATTFNGLDLSNVDFSIRHFTCKACSNNCEIQEITVGTEKTYWGDKCSERFRKVNKAIEANKAEDLVTFYLDNLTGDIENNNSGPLVAIPRTMYFFDRFPFWNTYFREIGARVIVSDETSKKIVDAGKEMAIAEPCFPIVSGHGHYKVLADNPDVDFVFIPNLANSETEFPDTESWVCPWGETLPLVIYNTINNQSERDRLLKPVFGFRDTVDEIKVEFAKIARKLGVSKKISDKAIDKAFIAMDTFNRAILEKGTEYLANPKNMERSVVIVGRPYNIFDSGLNLNIPSKLRENYGINPIPHFFLPIKGIDIADIHPNMFWNYGKKILQAARFAGDNNINLIYFTNFKCGPDSYIKHFVRNAHKSPYLTLQFDDHSNDAGILTRCEAYLVSKGLLEK